MARSRQSSAGYAAVRNLAAVRREIRLLRSGLERLGGAAMTEIANEWRRAVDAIADPILIHDADFRIVRANRAYVREAGVTFTDVLGKRYWEVFPTERGPLESCAAALEQECEEAEEEIALADGRIFHVRTFAVRDDDGAYRYTVHVLHDITEQRRAAEQVRQQAAQIHRGLVQGVEALGHAIEKRDPYTAGHQGRVARIASAMASEMGWSEARAEGLRMGAFIHDIGKIHVPAEILNRPGPLDGPEMEMIRTHARVGYEIVKDVDFPWPVAEMILQHHERLDGSGYPQGLHGDHILAEARVLAVADAIEAMTTHRPYRPAFTLKAALAEIAAERGRSFDANAVDACIRVFRIPRFRQSLRAG